MHDKLPAPNPVRAVLFDLYGTLVDVTIDTRPSEVWTTLAADLAVAGNPVSAHELRRRYHEQVANDTREHGEPFVLNADFFHDLLRTGDDPHPSFVASFARRFRRLTTREIRLRAYALPLLAALRRSGCKTGLVSNTDAKLTDHDLDVLKLRDQFDAVVLSSQVGMKKPDPRIFDIALRQLRVPPHEAVHIGDDYNADLLGAVGAHLRPVLLRPGSRSEYCVRPRLSEIVRALQHHGWRGEHLRCSP
jgi:putative hydrolase of the HAD superfamily